MKNLIKIEIFKKSLKLSVSYLSSGISETSEFVGDYRKYQKYRNAMVNECQLKIQALHWIVLISLTLV